jgi:hypothetical protein
MALWAAGIVLLSSGVPVGVVAQGAQAPAAATRLLQRTPHFEVYLGTGSLSRADALRLAARLESTVEKVGQRLGMPFNARERIYFQAPQRGVCAVRGLTTSSRRQIQLFYGPGTEIDRLQAILAHELAHQLQRERFGDRVQRAADIVLLEGWAVVASDDFARTPDGSEARWRDRLREVVARNELLPLTVDLNQDCRTTTRNAIYDEWASFVDFLLKRNGNDALAALYRSSTGRRAGTANYQGVYGKSFMELEAEWRAWVITQ